MCGIVGVLAVGINTAGKLDQLNKNLAHILNASHARGRDGFGYLWRLDHGKLETSKFPGKYRFDITMEQPLLWELIQHGEFLANFRAEPTTEYVRTKTKDDQQPYSAGEWAIVHNGTVANDRELRTHSIPTKVDSAAIVEHLDRTGVFERAVQDIRGSYAILATRGERGIFAATNFRPVWIGYTEDALYFASARDYLPPRMQSRMLTPYSWHLFYTPEHYFEPDIPFPRKDLKSDMRRALVVCSGGMDSTVAATVAKRDYDSVELIHFQYGSRAEGPEVQAVKAIGEYLNVPAHFMPLPIYQPEDSPLLRADSKIAGGEAGAEFAHEWVPARNLVMLSIATAVAEARGIGTVILGNNLEEANYADNEPEFIHRFNDVLPFAVGGDRLVHVEMPIGNLMKHEIVKLGHDVGAPLHLTWSCYRAGPLHCGTCGPCYMRRVAHEINSLPESIGYMNE